MVLANQQGTKKVCECQNKDRRYHHSVHDLQAMKRRQHIWKYRVLLERSEERSLEWYGFATNEPDKPQGAPQGSAIGPEQYQVAHQWSVARVVDAVEIEGNKFLAQNSFLLKMLRGFTISS
jgi:hypothetical protein